ncbi:chimeric ERCC6-PGBD3 protein [Trichonephila clavipes]|uniref:Chimeric ERCC6-PGBD3 protein n=1 Tax=Trichonephila clavipes TaxID=2585209 RepID=A0A8X6UZZ9_TRICX|nr:chimeric ERCC6-PGBD3 protein [Trichonephila clavipes]
MYFSIDKSPVPYFGRYGCKQFVRGKPIHLAKYEEYGLGATVVLQLADALTEEHPEQYNFVFDNFFTSIPLLDKLSSMDHQETGAVKKGRIDKPPLESDVVLKKNKRGPFDYRIDGNGNIVCR